MNQSQKDMILSAESKVKNMTLAEFEKIQLENWYLQRAFCEHLKVEEGNFCIHCFGNTIGYFKTYEDAMTYGCNVLCGPNEDSFIISESE